MRDNVPIEALINSDQYKNQFAVLFALMRASAVTEIKWGFSGGGDSGDVDEGPEWEGLHKESVPLENIETNLVVDEYAGTTYKPGVRNGVKTYRPVECSNLHELARQMVGVVLDNDPHDWYNNDGGFGNIVFSITPEGKNHILVDMNINETVSTAVPSEFEFDNG